MPKPFNRLILNTDYVTPWRLDTFNIPKRKRFAERYGRACRLDDQLLSFTTYAEPERSRPHCKPEPSTPNALIQTAHSTGLIGGTLVVCDSRGDMIMQARASAPSPAVFVLEIEGQAILAFRASTYRQAQELGKEDWLKQDLKRMTTGHRPLWDGKALIKVRRAEPAEEAQYGEAKAENAAGDLPLVFLVRRDDEADASTAGPRGAFPPHR